MGLKGPSETDNSEWKPTRQGGTDNRDIGGPSRDLSKDIERWSKVRGGKSGRC